MPHFDESAQGQCGEYINRSILETFAFSIADKILSLSMGLLSGRKRVIMGSQRKFDQVNKNTFCRPVFISDQC